MEYDNAYSSKIDLAAYKVFLDTSRYDADAALVKTGPAFDALMMVATILVAKDPKFESSDVIRAFTGRVSRKLGQHIRQIRKD